MKLLAQLGQYIVFLQRLFQKPERARVYGRRIVDEMYVIGIGSFGIVAFISVFLGAVISIQTSHNLFNQLVPKYVIAIVTRDSVILEFSCTIVCLVLAGKVGSSIASELGTMKVTEQIDALEIMGINAAGYLVVPKIIAAVFITPFIVVTGIVISLTGGLVGGVMAGVISSDEFIYGLQYQFLASNVWFCILKTVVFAFLITSVSAYHGFRTEGGAYQVGESSTHAVVYSSILILVFDYILTQIFLS